jgi:hypothetical protein
MNPTTKPPSSSVTAAIDRAVMTELERQREAGTKYLASLNVDAIVSAICAAVHVQRTWQPIETAPKDGTRFAAYQNGEPYPCEWREDQPDEGPPRSGWFDLFNLSFEEPTLWLHLPAVTSTDGGGK